MLIQKNNLVIRWIQETPVHRLVLSRYYNQDQPGLKNQTFRPDTSLFQDQVPEGNASLQMNNVTFKDEGTYLCYTKTNNSVQKSKIVLKVSSM